MERHSCLDTGFFKCYLRWPRVPETSTCQCSWRLLSEKWEVDSGVTGDLHPPCPRSAGQAGCPKHQRQQNTFVSKSFSDSSDQWENFSCLNIGTYIWCLLFEIHLTQTQRTEVSTDLTTYPPSFADVSHTLGHHLKQHWIFRQLIWILLLRWSRTFSMLPRITCFLDVTS